MRRSFRGIQWSGSVEASVSDRYPAFKDHYRAQPAKLERNFLIKMTLADGATAAVE